MPEPEENVQGLAETESEEIEVVAHGRPTDGPDGCCILDLGNDGPDGS
ncbi:hypothetical protein AB0L00_18355 [Actinoallomurus sp. NPDC052308]